MEQTYGDLHDITIPGKVYQIQSVDNEFNTSFILKMPGAGACKIFINEEGEWEADRVMPEHELTQILQKIKPALRIISN